MTLTRGGPGSSARPRLLSFLSMPRLFLAVPVPDDVRAAVVAAIAPLRAGGADISWAHADTLHVTMRFLGDTDEAAIPALISALRVPGPAPELTVGGGGGFPSTRSPRVLWVGVQGDLAPVAAAVDAAVQAVLGMAPERRAFHAHLTVGRVRRGHAAREAAALEALGELGRFVAPALVLFQSELRPEGARHSVIQELPFA